MLRPNNYLRSLLAQVLTLACCLGLTSCAVSTHQVTPASKVPTAASSHVEPWVRVNRLTWGVNVSTLETFKQQGAAQFLSMQLHPQLQPLALQVQQQIDQMTVQKTPLIELVQQLEKMRQQADSAASDEEKKQAQQLYQQELNRLQREAATRHLLRAMYSPHQVLEQMTWFWMNHFNVHQGKANLRALIGDYEESAVRPHALGHFRGLLGAVVTHPAMLRYLDNEQNAAGRVNENFARELLELHTLGVHGGYSQRDVQEMARVLTGHGVNAGVSNPGLKKEWQSYHVRKGMYEFNPSRHDFGSKTFLGQSLQGRGVAELNEALDRLAKHPATAQFLARKLAVYWLSDEPPSTLVKRMAEAYLTSQGHIASTLQVMFESPEFDAAAGTKFKDPMRFMLSSLRLAYDQRVILNAGPMMFWLSRMGQPLYGRVSPDGYPLAGGAWDSPGQMTTRFEIAKAMGSGSAGLFKVEGPNRTEQTAFPRLSNALYFQAMEKSLSEVTLRALDQAASPQEWNTFLLSSPEMMYR